MHPDYRSADVGCDGARAGRSAWLQVELCTASVDLDCAGWNECTHSWHRICGGRLSHIYLGAVAFGVTLLVASLFLHGGKDIHHGHDSADALGWAPVTSLRFWVFFFAFGGGTGY